MVVVWLYSRARNRLDQIEGDGLPHNNVVELAKKKTTVTEKLTDGCKGPYRSFEGIIRNPNLQHFG